SSQGFSDSGSDLEVRTGDTIEITNTSTKGSGRRWSKCDFQISDGTRIIYSSTLLKEDDKGNIDSGISVSSIPMDKTGTYNIYLNVMDNEDMAKTEGWGNWGYNGYRVAGTNPGGGTGSDFPGWWYYARLTVIVKHNPPEADFTIEYQGSDVTDNKTDPIAIDPGDKSLMLKDCSKPFSPAEPITGRKWYYWDVGSGWKEIPGSSNKTTVNIPDMDGSLPGSGINKAFKLICTSSTGGEDYSEHTAYFIKVLASGYIVYYRDIDTDRDVYAPKIMEGLGFGTYTETAKSAPSNSKLVSPSPQTITLNASTPFTTITFQYKFSTPPSSNPPSAILDAPDTAMAGEVVKADGSKSWSNNPGGYIAGYYFEYEGANLISDNGSNVRIWYPHTGTYTIELEVEDEGGRTDYDEKEITVTPPIPTAVISITGKLKENRKVTISSSGSTSPTYYPIDTSKTTWSIAALSGGTAEDIKYTGVLNGNVTKDILFKKAGTYRVTLSVTNTYGRSASASQNITIAPDLPPVARLKLPTPDGTEYSIYRDPEDSNYATALIFNESYSPDGDTIGKAAALYCYDSDNDGSYTDEQWYYSKDGTTWHLTEMDYANTVGYFSISGIADSDIKIFTHKSKEVGRYWYVIRVMEDIPEDETISEFLIESDYKRADTFN
nr:PKD domain-containing protein [Bacillota bacterium]